MKNKIAQELGKRGGQKTASLHGKKHFSKAGKKGTAKRWKEQRKATAHEEPWSMIDMISWAEGGCLRVLGRLCSLLLDTLDSRRYVLVVPSAMVIESVVSLTVTSIDNSFIVQEGLMVNLI